MARKQRMDDYYITFLKYARKKMSFEGTIDYVDIFGHVHGIHPEIKESNFKRTFLQAVVTVIFQGREARDEDISNGTPMVLSLEAYFHLLEHEEMEEARQASKRAETHARRAIFVAIGIAILTLAFSINEHFAPNEVRINKTQVQEMQNFIQTENDRLAAR